MPAARVLKSRTMPKYLFEIIIFIFLVHFILFLRLSLLRRKKSYILATASFLLLIIYASMRVWAPQITFLHHHGYTYFRVLAWGTSATTLTLYIRGRLQKDPKG
jgi:hypothetical protein